MLNKINSRDLLLARLVAFVHDHQTKPLSRWVSGLKELFGVEVVVRDNRKFTFIQELGIEHGQSYILTEVGKISVNLFSGRYLEVSVVDGVVSSTDWSEMVRCC